MNESQNEKREFPKPFRTDWRDDGSRTIDCGHRYTVSVEEYGICIQKEHGPWSVGDLFGELSYWPEQLVWSGSARTLAELLVKLAKAAGVSDESLLAPIMHELDDCQELEIAAFLVDEKKAAGDDVAMTELWQRWAPLQGSHQIPGIPSPECWEECWETFYRGSVSPEDCCYNGLELDFDEGGWTARLYGYDPNDVPPFFQRETWYAKSFDSLFTARDQFGNELRDHGFPLTRDDLVKMLIEDDPRWRSIIEAE